MIVDDELVDAARELLERCFGADPGAATAVYTLEGNCYSSVSLNVTSPTSCVAPEVGAMCEAFKNGERISAVATVERRTQGGPVLFTTPSGTTVDQLALTAAREAEITTHNLAREDDFFIRPLRSLTLAHASQIELEGTYDAGLGPLGKQLRQLARVQGMRSVRAQWGPCLRSGLENDLVHRQSQKQGKPRHPAEFIHPNNLESRQLRHIWNGFEAASHAFFRAILDHHEEGLRDLDCNESDLLHIRQGAESLRAIFANLLVWVGKRQPIENEMPFLPYYTTRLRSGIPMHEYFGEASAVRAAQDPLKELIHLLTETGKGGVAGYLRQRELFFLKVFDEGIGRCPFDSVTLSMYQEAGRELDKADCQSLLLLDD